MQEVFVLYDNYGMSTFELIDFILATTKTKEYFSNLFSN